MKRFIPLGSIVSLTGSEKRFMITGYMQREVESEKIWDYCACFFPEGNVDAHQAILFDEGQVDKFFFVGLQDSESMEFHEKLSLSLDNSHESEDHIPNEEG
jgi:hypothetical protein